MTKSAASAQWFRRWRTAGPQQSSTTARSAPGEQRRRREFEEAAAQARNLLIFGR